MRILKYTTALAAAALLAAACSRDRMEEEPQFPQSSGLPICCNVKEVASSSGDTRVLIGNETSSRPTNPAAPNFYITIPEVCTVPENDPNREAGFAIGLFCDYSYVENGKTVTVYDLYRGARLVYLPDVTISPKVHSKWDTNVGMRYWQPDAKYIFRAYYPQRLHNYTISNSNASTLTLVYPTRKLQYDLLLGAATVEATQEQMTKAVPITLTHALAALRFEFKLNFEDADLLTSVYLLNDEECHYFSQGTVSYGETDDIHSMKWLQDYNPPASEILYKWVPPLKYWYGEDKDGDGVIETDGTEELSADEMLEKWGWVDGKPVNIPLDVPAELGNKKYNPVLMYSNSEIQINAGEGTTPGSGETAPGSGETTPGSGETTPGSANNITYRGKTAQAYYGMESYYDWKTDKKWKYSASDEVAAEGMLYCRNSGWLLIPPQESYGKLTLCFTTKKGGETVYKVQLPQKTGTKLKADGTLVTGGTDATEGKDVWAAGKRYTYLVTISQSNFSVDVSIKDWNERKHSTEIIF